MIKTLLSAGMICIASLGFAQSGLTNLSFETWTTVPSPSPAGFISLGATQMTVGAQHLTSYVRLTSNGVAAASLGNGAMRLGSITGFTTVVPGAPYATRPSAFTGYYKSTIMANDSAFLSFDLKKNGASIITNTVVKGVIIIATTNTWTSFSLAINYSSASNPDSAFINVAANKNWAGPNHPVGTSGTILDVDNFNFVSSSNVQSFEDQALLLGAYPNPATENFNIISKSPNAVKVEVYDLSGRIMENKLFESDKVSINVNNYTPGLYIYKVYDNANRALKTGKFTVTQ